MERFTAFVLLAIGLVYSDLDADSVFYSLALPGLVLATLLYLFWLRAFMALTGAVLCWHFMDLESHSLLSGGLMPLLFALCVLLFIFWSGLGRLLGGGRGSSDGGDIGGFGGFDGFGGDGGDGGGDGGGD